MRKSWKKAKKRDITGSLLKFCMKTGANIEYCSHAAPALPCFPCTPALLQERGKSWGQADAQRKVPVLLCAGGRIFSALLFGHYFCCCRSLLLGLQASGSVQAGFGATAAGVCFVCGVRFFVSEYIHISVRQPEQAVAAAAAAAAAACLSVRPWRQEPPPPPPL